MQVKIHKDIFQENSFLEDLDNMLKHFRTRKHELILDDADDIEAFYNSQWCNDMPKRNLDIINAYIKSSVRANRLRKRIEVSTTDTEKYFAPTEADRYLDQPLTLLLENGENDSPFVDAIFAHLDPTGELSEAKKNNSIKYGMGGGSTIGAVIRTELRDAYLDQCFTKNKNRYLRYFVIIDSDRLYPGMSVAVHKTKELVENDIPHHILFKREAENYMPYALLKDFKDPYLNAYLNLPEASQRDFFDLQGGFHDKNRKTAKDYQKSLYNEESITEEHWNLLRKGIQLEPYKTHFKSEFPKLFQSDKLDKKIMLEVISEQPRIGNLNEFEHIVNEIKKLL